MSLALLVPTILAFVGPELNVGPLTQGPAILQSLPVVAFDGSRYLVLFHDHRNGGEGHVLARFLSSTGVAQGDEFNLLESHGDKNPGGLIFDGTQFVAAINFGGFPAVVRITSAGEVLDPGGLVISGSAYSPVRMAFDGNQYVLVWSDPRGSFQQIYAARITRNGHILDPGGVLISSNLTTHALEPDIFFDGTDFLVSWKEDASLISTHVAADLQLVAPGPAIYFTSATSLVTGPRLVGIAGAAVATFSEQAADGDNEPRIIPVAPAATAVVISTAHTYDQPNAVFDGTRYVAWWSDSDTCRVFAGRFSTALVPQDGEGLQLIPGTGGTHSQATIALDRSGGGLLAFTSQVFNHTIATSPFTSATLTANATAAPLSVAAPHQAEPAIAQAGDRTVVGWVETSEVGRNVFLASLNNSTVSPGASISLTTGQGNNEELTLASDGADRVLAVWRNESGELESQRTDAQGVAIGAKQTLCSGSGIGTGLPRVAWDGAQFVVLFLQEDGATSTHTIRWLRVAADGTPSQLCGEQVALIDHLLFSLHRVQLAAAGNGVLLFTWDMKNENTYEHSIEFVRARGTVLLDAAPQTLATRADAARAVWNGTDFVVVWHASRRWSNDIMGQRVPPMGAVTDAAHPLVTTDADERHPNVAFDGARLLLTWEDWRSGRPDVWAALIAPDLSAVAAEPFEISATNQEESASRVVTVGPGRFAVAYTRFNPSQGVRAQRVGVRWVSDLDDAATCSQDGECRSGFCSDGVCCDSRCGADTNDCQACAVAAGAASDGTCSALAAATECRASGSECDVAERCDGAALTCPVDQQRADGLACAGGAGVCGGGACRTGSAPHFTSAVSVRLLCGQTYSYSKAGRPEVAGDGPFTFSARSADGAPLPEGFSIDGATGEISWQTTRAQVGSVIVELRVESPAGVDTQLVELVVECEQRKVAVSCSQAGALGLPLLLLALLRRRRHVTA